MSRPISNLATVSFAILLFSSSPRRGDEPKPAEPGDAMTFPLGDATELGIDKAALGRLRERAGEADSDAVVIVVPDTPEKPRP